MKTPVKDYVPYSPEWKKYVMQMKKEEIVNILSEALIWKDERIKMLESTLKKYEVRRFEM